MKMKNGAHTHIEHKRKVVQLVEDPLFEPGEGSGASQQLLAADVSSSSLARSPCPTTKG